MAMISRLSNVTKFRSAYCTSYFKHIMFDFIYFKSLINSYKLDPAVFLALPSSVTVEKLKLPHKTCAKWLKT